MSPLELTFAVRQDPWGMKASTSVIGELLLRPEHPMWEKNVGEAWCGSHPQRPAGVSGSKDNLLELIRREPEAVLGKSLFRKSGPQLPFLFKILTVQSPLSIQVHPSLEKAVDLSKRFPEKYPDCSEKPEIGIAISETKLLLGFKPLDQVLSVLASLQPAQKFFEKEINSPSLKALFQRLLTASEEEVNLLNFSTAELLKLKQALTEEEEQFLTLYSMYPTDSGVYQGFLLNLVTLKAGEGIFIPPDTVHAYLSGQLLECMATSDFVIRAGLTAKEKHIEGLLEVVGYEPFTVDKLIPTTSLFEFSPYIIPTKEFRLERFTGKCLNEVNCPDSPTVYFCLRGSGQISSGGSTLSLVPGSICLLYAGQKHIIALDGEFYRILVDSDS